MNPLITHITQQTRHLITHSGFRKYFFNTSWVFAEKVLRLISGLFIGAYVARYLEPNHYGLLNYVISLVSLFSAFSALGLDQIIIRELVKNEHKRDLLLGTAFTLKVTGAAVVFLFLTVAMDLLKTDALTKNLVYIIAFGMMCEAFNVIDCLFQSKVWSKYVVWGQVISLSIISILRIYFVFLKAPLTWFAWINTLDILFVALSLIFFYQIKGYHIFKWKFKWSVAFSLLKNSWPLIFSVLAITIYMKIDQVMIKWMLGDEANGQYAVAVRLCEMWNFIPMAICASLFPAILNAKNISAELYHKRLQWLYNTMVIISISLAIPMTFFSEWIVDLFFGPAYADAGSVLALYIWASVFTFLGVANGKWIISENLQVFRMVNLIVASLINIILNYFLITYVGLIGAAIATLIAYAYAGYLSFLLTKKTRNMFFSMTRSFNPLAWILDFTEK